MMQLTSIVLLALWAQVVHSEQSAPVIKHLKVGSMDYIDAGKSHFGFTHEENGIYKTVAVNGHRVSVWMPDCTSLIRNMNELNSVDRSEINTARKLIANAHRRFNDLKGGQESMIEIFKTGNEPNPTRTVNQLNEHGTARYHFATTDQVDYGLREVSVAGPKLPEKMMRAFVLKNAIGYVYEDRFIIMKPRSCQFDDDKAFLKALDIKF